MKFTEERPPWIESRLKPRTADMDGLSLYN
jgi:hypothetical protein